MFLIIIIFFYYFHHILSTLQYLISFLRNYILYPLSTLVFIINLRLYESFKKWFNLVFAQYCIIYYLVCSTLWRVSPIPNTSFSHHFLFPCLMCILRSSSFVNDQLKVFGARFLKISLGSFWYTNWKKNILRLWGLIWNKIIPYLVHKLKKIVSGVIPSQE